MSSEDFSHELIKNVDSEEMFSSFIIEMPRELTDAEKAVKRELGLLRRLRRTLTDINQIKKEEKPKAVRPGEKAKEEAMQLLRSGVISITDKSERHLGRRKSKEHEEDEITANVTACNTATSAPTTPSKKSTFKSKAFPYKSFLRGDTLYPLNRANSPDSKASSFYALRDTLPGDSDIHVGRRKSSSPSPAASISDSLTDAAVAASKRKQQLIALMSEEEEYADEATTAVGNLAGDSDAGVRRDDAALVVESSGPNLYEVGEEPHSQGYRSGLAAEAGVTLHVGYHNVTEDVVRELLGPFGTILRVKISDQQTHAYVTMATREMAEKALELDHQMVNNRLLRVTLARRQFPHAPYRRGGVGDPGSGDRRHCFRGAPSMHHNDRWRRLASPVQNAVSLDAPPSGEAESQVTGRPGQPRDLVGYGDLFPDR